MVKMLSVLFYLDTVYMYSQHKPFINEKNTILFAVKKACFELNHMTISWLCVCDVTNHIVTNLSRDDGNAENDLLVGFQDGNVDCDDCDFHDNVDDIRTKRAELMLHIGRVLHVVHNQAGALQKLMLVLQLLASFPPACSFNAMVVDMQPLDSSMSRARSAGTVSNG